MARSARLGVVRNRMVPARSLWHGLRTVTFEIHKVATIDALLPGGCRKWRRSSEIQNRVEFTRISKNGVRLFRRSGGETRGFCELSRTSWLDEDDIATPRPRPQALAAQRGGVLGSRTLRLEVDLSPSRSETDRQRPAGSHWWRHMLRCSRWHCHIRGF